MELKKKDFKYEIVTNSMNNPWKKENKDNDNLIEIIIISKQQFASRMLYLMLWYVIYISDRKNYNSI